MPTNVKTVAGTTLFVKVNSDDEYVEVGEITDLGEYGPTFEEITHKPIKSFTTYKFTGAKDYGQLALQLGQDLEDAGQEILRDNLGGTVFCKIEFPDAPVASGGSGTLDEFEAVVLSFKTRIGVVNNIIAATCNLSISGDVTRTPATS
jgi:hypothetical protein